MTRVNLGNDHYIGTNINRHASSVIGYKLYLNLVNQAESHRLRERVTTPVLEAIPILCLNVRML
jgi:hypothetical protein